MKNDQITEILRKEFPSFGGGLCNTNNPISIAMSERPSMFAAGVDIQEVVDRVIELKRKKK